MVAFGDIAIVGDIAFVGYEEVVAQLGLTCHREVFGDIDVVGGNATFIDSGVVGHRQFFGDVHRGRVDAFQVGQVFRQLDFKIAVGVLNRT